jgi:hypothetical protein
MDRHGSPARGLRRHRFGRFAGGGANARCTRPSAPLTSTPLRTGARQTAARIHRHRRVAADGGAAASGRARLAARPRRTGPPAHRRPQDARCSAGPGSSVEVLSSASAAGSTGLSLLLAAMRV